MTFVSYAQNFEDVMLWRALKHVGQGFYIDVGAAWPEMHSVTKAFYERGWQGINIEPNTHLLQQCIAHRTRDINLGVALSDHHGSAEMFFVPGTGLSSLNTEVIEGHIRSGWEVSPCGVEVTTLAEVCTQYARDREIHFLKVDVEGLEERVLKGHDWARFKPWIVVVEATFPMSQTESHASWEPILLSAAYEFAYADGVNRFYVSGEHSELLAAFRYPPNFFDEFKLTAEFEAQTNAQQAGARAAEAEAQTRQAEARAAEAEARAAEAEVQTRQAGTRAAEAEAQTRQAEARAAGAEARSQAILDSMSWRITAPLRWMGSAGLSITAMCSDLKSRLLFRLLSWLGRVAAFVFARPALTAAAIRILDHAPAIKYRLWELLSGQGPRRAVAHEQDSNPPTTAASSPRHIAAVHPGELKQAIAMDLERELTPCTQRQSPTDVTTSLFC